MLPSWAAVAVEPLSQVTYETYQFDQLRIVFHGGRNSGAGQGDYLSLFV